MQNKGDPIKKSIVYITFSYDSKMLYVFVFLKERGLKCKHLVDMCTHNGNGWWVYEILKSINQLSDNFVQK